MSHCFISYSTADGVDFLQNLVRELEGGTPYVPAWYDTRNIPPGTNWEDEIVEAIKSCKCMLFVMSTDSTKTSSDCRKEILFALRYKKPIIPLLIHKNAEPIFMIATREWIDFSNFNAGLGKLRKYIQELDLPVGQLRLLKERLADAEHDLRRATGEEADRIRAEIEDLNKEIDNQKRIADNPKKAEEQTQANIAAGLERERKPQLPLAAIQSTKFINPPPGIAPNYFQDRIVETEQVFKFLQDDSQRMMTIVGRGGVGKTAMVCRLLKGLEGGELPDGLGRMRVEGIVYLSESGSHRVNFANLFYDLCKLLPADAANALDAVYKNPQASTASKMSAMLDRFTAGKVVLLLDNVEPLISVETFDIADAELDECLRALLHGAHSALKVILTTRVAPRGLNLCEPGRQRVLTLDSGLEQKYAVEMLREMDVDGKLGLKSAAPEALKRACERTLGFPRALEALFAILASDRYTTLEELLAMPTPVNVVEALVGEAFNRLDTNAQKVMQALAVYNRPVTPAAVDYLLAPHIPAMDSAPILQRLANMHFARKESGRFYLHPVDREFAFGLIPEKELTTKDTKVTKEEEKVSDVPDVSDVIKVKPDDVIPASETDEESARKAKQAIEKLEALLAKMKVKETNYHLLFTKHDLVSRAADYFAQARKPRTEWRKLDDLSAQLAEFDLRCAAGDYDTAASVLLEIDGEYLYMWGHYRLMIDLHKRISGKITDLNLRMQNLNRLELAYKRIGEIKESLTYLEVGLSLARRSKNRNNESAYLGNLGNAYFFLGERHKAIEYHEQALIISREIGNQKGISYRLGNLGIVYGSLGNTQKAIEYFEQALTVLRELGDKDAQGTILGNLGNVYGNLGNIHKAIEFYEQALIIAREIGDRFSESVQLGNMGDQYEAIGDDNKALSCYVQSLEIKRDIGDRQGEAIFLEGIGNVHFVRGDYLEANKCYQQSILIADDISYPPEQLNARIKLSESHLLQNDLLNARATIEAALGYDVPEYNHNASALHGIIALRQGDEVAARGAFVRAIGQADEILSKTAEYYSALDAKGLAICGLVLCRGAVPAPNGDGANTGRGDPAPTIDDAIETFRKARKIAPHAGIVKSVLRLFDELVKCDQDGVLKNVRAAVEGKE